MTGKSRRKDDFLRFLRRTRKAWALLTSIFKRRKDFSCTHIYCKHLILCLPPIQTDGRRNEDRSCLCLAHLCLCPTTCLHPYGREGGREGGRRWNCAARRQHLAYMVKRRRTDGRRVCLRASLAAYKGQRCARSADIMTRREASIGHLAAKQHASGQRASASSRRRASATWRKYEGTQRGEISRKNSSRIGIEYQQRARAISAYRNNRKNGKLRAAAHEGAVWA